MSDFGHGYLSTACIHGLHDRCRLVCKFCDTPCLCQCHWINNPNLIRKLLSEEREKLQ